MKTNFIINTHGGKLFLKYSSLVIQLKHSVTHDSLENFENYTYIKIFNKYSNPSN